jgi:hypothetical protein
MTDHSDQADRFLLPDPEEDGPEGFEPDNDYEWAEYNLPVFPAARSHLSEEAGDEPDFIGLAIDMDSQPFGNS